MFHFSQLSGIFLAQKQHTCLQKLFLTSKNSSKEYFVERKQIKSATAAYFKLRLFGGKTCHVCTQLEHVFFLTCTRLDATGGTPYRSLQKECVVTYKVVVRRGCIFLDMIFLRAYWKWQKISQRKLRKSPAKGLSSQNPFSLLLIVSSFCCQYALWDNVKLLYIWESGCSTEVALWKSIDIIDTYLWERYNIFISKSADNCIWIPNEIKRCE